MSIPSAQNSIGAYAPHLPNGQTVIMTSREYPANAPEHGRSRRLVIDPTMAMSHSLPSETVFQPLPYYVESITETFHLNQQSQAQPNQHLQTVQSAASFAFFPIAPTQPSEFVPPSVSYPPANTSVAPYTHQPFSPVTLVPESPPLSTTYSIPKGPITTVSTFQDKTAKRIEIDSRNAAKHRNVQKAVLCHAVFEGRECLSETCYNVYDFENLDIKIPIEPKQPDYKILSCTYDNTSKCNHYGLWDCDYRHSQEFIVPCPKRDSEQLKVWQLKIYSKLAGKFMTTVLIHPDNAKKLNDLKFEMLPEETKARFKKLDPSLNDLGFSMSDPSSLSPASAQSSIFSAPATHGTPLKHQMAQATRAQVATSLTAPLPPPAPPNSLQTASVALPTAQPKGAATNQINHDQKSAMTGSATKTKATILW